MPDHNEDRHDGEPPSRGQSPPPKGPSGAEPTDEMQGVDLLDGESAAQREAIFGEIFTHNAIDIDRPVSSLEYRWCIEGRWKLIVPHKSGVPLELYDLTSDPHEKNNLAADRPDDVRRLQVRADAWWPAEE